MELPLLSPLWFYQALSELAPCESKPQYGFARPPCIKIAEAPPLEAQARGGLEKITGHAFHRAGLNRELAMHDRKIQGMKLATAPFLCELSPKTSVAPCCIYLYLYIYCIFSFAVLSITNAD